MNEEVIADLKQFIAATISQQMSGVATKEDLATLQDEITGIKGDLARVERKVDDLQEAVGEALGNTNDAIQEQLNMHVRQYHAVYA